MNNNLMLATEARTERRYDDAKKYYELARQEAPDDFIIEYYYQLSSIHTSDNRDLPKEFALFCDTIESTLEKASQEKIKDIYSVDALSEMIETMVDTLILVPEYMDTNYKIFDSNLVLKTKKLAESFVLHLGDKIEEIFGNSSEYAALSVKCWEYAIESDYDAPGGHYINFKQKGLRLWIHEYADKIKKYKPTYKLPEYKKQGAFAFGDAAHAPVRPLASDGGKL